MSKSSIEGLDELQRELAKLQRKAEQLSGTRSIPIEEILTAQFMQRYTRFASLSEMLDHSGVNGTTEDDFEAFLQMQEREAFVAANTQFASWQDLLDQAGSEYIARLWQE